MTTKKFPLRYVCFPWTRERLTCAEGGNAIGPVFRRNVSQGPQAMEQAPGLNQPPTGERQVITWSEHGLEIRDLDLYHNSSYKTVGEQTYINSMWNGDRVIVRIKRDSGHKVLSTVPGIQSLPNNDNSRRCCQFYFIYLAIRFTSIGLHDILLIGRITYGTSQN